MNKKSLAAAVLTGLMALSLIGCGGGDKRTEKGGTGKRREEDCSACSL